MAMIPEGEWREIAAGMVMQEPTPSNALARDPRSGKSFSFVFGDAMEMASLTATVR